MKYPKGYLISLILSTALLGACGQDSQVKVLEAQIHELDAKTKALEKTVQALSVKDLLSQFEGVAYLTPGSDGYSLVKSDLGMLTVSLTNIQPYASGTKVTLQFGNLMAATINGVKATLEWGSLDKKGSPIAESTKSREVKFNESLRSGGWTRADVVLEGIPPTELAFVRVREVGHTGVSLVGR